MTGAQNLLPIASTSKRVADDDQGKYIRDSSLLFERWARFPNLFLIYFIILEKEICSQTDGECFIVRSIVNLYIIGVNGKENFNPAALLSQSELNRLDAIPTFFAGYNDGLLQ